MLKNFSNVCIEIKKVKDSFYYLANIESRIMSCCSVASQAVAEQIKL